MRKYIDKDAALAEIEKRIRACGNCYILDELASLHRTFNSFEVKEVDFHKELLSFYRHTNDSGSEIALAKHFFELGMHVNNPITAADRGTAEEIIINLNRVEKDYHINLTREIEWLRNQVKK